MFQITSKRIVYKEGESFVVECPGIDKVVNDDYETAWNNCEFKMPTNADLDKRKLELQEALVPYDVIEAAVMLVNSHFDTPRIFAESWSPNES